MARIIIADSDILSETRRIKLEQISPGRVVKIDNPNGEPAYYIINKIPNSEHLSLKHVTVALTNLASGRLVQKRSDMLVTPISADVFIKLFPKNTARETTQNTVRTE